MASDSTIAPRVGGSAAFLRFIRDELVPTVEARWPASGERAIIGESLAGLFIVETFLREPGLFDHHVALDPSLWWNGGALVDSAAALVAAHQGGARALYLASSDAEEIAPLTARLAEILRASPAGARVTYQPRPDLTHGTIFRGVKPAALAAVLPADR